MSEQSESIQPMYPTGSQESDIALYKVPKPQIFIQSLMGKEKQKQKRNHDQEFQNKEKPISSNIENGNQVNFYYQKLINFDNILLLSCVANLLFSIIYADIDYFSSTPEDFNIKLVLMILTVFMGISLIVMFFRYHAVISIEISRIQLSSQNNLWNSDKITEIVIDLLILLLQPYPFLNNITITAFNVRNNYTYDLKLNYVLAIACFLKIYIIARILLEKTTYMSPRSKRVCKMYEADNNYLYAIKGLFIDSPMMLIGVSFIVSIFMFALIFRICERDLTAYDKIHGLPPVMDLQNIINVFWFTIITMTTVGYGDIYPRTLIGRIIDVILIVWGSVIVSLIIVVLTNSLTMDISEKRALTVLNRLELKQIEKQISAKRIAIQWIIILLKRRLKMEKNSEKIQQLNRKFKILIIRKYELSKQMKQIKQQAQSMLELDDLFQQLIRQFDSFIDEINDFMDNQDKVQNNFAEFINKNGKSIQKAKQNKNQKQNKILLYDNR